MKRILVFICGWMLLATVVSAAKIGDPAAPLQVAEWIKGGPVALAEGMGKTVYVVEFWATWCPPCRESAPHLTKLQAKFKDKGVVVVGITDEKPKPVKKFVEKMGAKMEYAVGIDAKEQTSKAYMEAYKQEGIPTAFVIDRSGAVVWVGHPMDELEKVLEAVLAGTFKPKALPEGKKAAAGDEEDSLLAEYFELAMRRSGEAELAKAGQEVLKELGKDSEKLNEFAWMILTQEGLMHRDYPLALRAARRAVEQTKEKEFASLDTYARALFMTGQTNEAVATQQKAIELCKNPKVRLELKETLLNYQQPETMKAEGWDDEEWFLRFVNESAALVKEKRTVPLAKLLANTDVQASRVKLAKPSTRPVSSTQLYEQARASVLLVGTVVKSEEIDGDWDVGAASGFVIHESGIFVTNFHVLDQLDAEGMTAMTSDGRVYPVKSVLAVAPAADIAICQLDGASRLRPVAIAPNAKPGARIRVLSHPDNAFYSLTEGVLSRYSVYRNQGKMTTILTTTADFAVGSSGAPLFDEQGNVVGMVASTSSIYSGPMEFEEGGVGYDAAGASDENGDLQMVLKMCVPSSDILKLVGGLSGK